MGKQGGKINSHSRISGQMAGDLLTMFLRCPYQDDHYLSTLVPVDEFSGVNFPSHYKRFIVKMFTFVDGETFAPRKARVGAFFF